jgi:alcohol dehydrogenase (cytochrome c)
VKLPVLCFLAALWALSSSAQGLNPHDLLKPLGDEWPTYNGDYSGRRFSHLSQIHTANVKNLVLGWSYDTGGVPSKATPLMVNGILYVTVPDHAWAIDARTGRLLWHWQNKSRGGTHIGNRGPAMYENWLFLLLPTITSFRWMLRPERNGGASKLPT